MAASFAAGTALIAAACGNGGGGDSDDQQLVDAEGITVHLTEPVQAIDHRLFGINVPAWANPDRLADPTFRRTTMESGATVLRLPGGSWSNSYHWLACEQQDESGCDFIGAARPSDFAAFLHVTGIPGMWTVSFNGTAQEAAALVAFFNGTVDDQTHIGVDRNGFDWGTVSRWAQLRADAGLPEPVPVALWEVGNEVYGAIGDAEGNCASFGWEQVWTCDGTLYVEGDGEHDGFLDYAAAMRAVDPTISIGAVGVADPASWSNFGNDVMKAASGAYDFYVVHDYGFDESASIEQVLSRPAEKWPSLVGGTDAALREHEPDRKVPVAVTEYNLISFQEGDTEGQMDEAVNALYIADMIGQMASTGVSIANLWNLVNGEADNGSDYGIVDADTGVLNPAYHALALWSQVGDELVATTSSYDAAGQVSVYATRSADGELRLIVLNKTGTEFDAALSIDGAAAVYDWSTTSASAAALDAEAMETSTGGVATATASATVGLPPYSITLVELTPTTTG